ncbi:MAG: sterol desaturase family protein, partial [Alphaproteobacteria bacterium]|nr:sterol desaturase family protein [Alphaproteobacteria bacterium]
MPESLMMWMDYFAHSAQMLLLVAVIFIPLSKLMPCNPEQPLWRKDSLTDLAYYFLSPFLQQVGRLVLIAISTLILHQIFSDDTLVGYMKTGYGPAATLPLWQQAAIVFIASDFLLYWIHRGFHGKHLWNFHAIHHSPTQVDFLSTNRFHFVNIWLAFGLVDTTMLAVGFSAESIACMATFNMLYSAMVHSNLNWTFGPFRYVFASPVFHRWHHTTEKEALNKNFAPTFPLLDVMFGTFYMPEG